MVLCDFLGRACARRQSNLQLEHHPEAHVGNEPAHLVSHFGHLASLVWAKLILGRFRDAMIPDSSRFLFFLF